MGGIHSIHHPLNVEQTTCKIHVSKWRYNPGSYEHAQSLYKLRKHKEQEEYGVCSIWRRWIQVKFTRLTSGSKFPVWPKLKNDQDIDVNSHEWNMPRCRKAA